MDFEASPTSLFWIEETLATDGEFEMFLEARSIGCDWSSTSLLALAAKLCFPTIPRAVFIIIERDLTLNQYPKIFIEKKNTKNCSG